MLDSGSEDMPGRHDDNLQVKNGASVQSVRRGIKLAQHLRHILGYAVYVVERPA